MTLCSGFSGCMMDLPLTFWISSAMLLFVAELISAGRPTRTVAEGARRVLLEFT